MYELWRRSREKIREHYTQEYFTVYASILKGQDKEEVHRAWSQWMRLIYQERLTLEIIELAQSMDGEEFKAYILEFLQCLGNCATLCQMILERKGGWKS